MPEENEAPDTEDQEEVEATEDADQDESQEGESEEADDSGDFDRERVLGKLKKLNSENRNLRKAKKDAEEQAKNAEGKDEQITALEAVKSRYETLGENGLPIKLAKWISATEPDEILEQAEELLSLGGGSKPPPTDQPQEKNRRYGKPHQSDEIGSLDDFAEKIYSQ